MHADDRHELSAYLASGSCRRDAINADDWGSDARRSEPVGDVGGEDVSAWLEEHGTPTESMPF